ncbi:S8 family serine peptidase [Streptomyces sp. XM4193]|uniref:S8 family serine peptidase n=1 Tax=Streptomyces sp. XM4193 TaxID=2929782 RepID=UPI001FFA992C|nr:S8 family serine peptidase [Streptomyces sp. XM4193]MCK1797194.1 S8 family serine peptidase [Streptomyces sp. XM4193]
MDAESMWEESKGRGITVAVIDGGVDGTLPELRGKLIKGKNLFSPSKSPYRDLGGHGTSMAALIAGSGEEGGIQGLAPESEIIPVTVSPGVVDLFSKIPEAIDHAVKSGADIINMSFGGSNREDPAVQAAIDRANKANVLLFAGSGNEGTNATAYPAGYAGVVAVGATGESGKVTDFSQYGAHLALAAPGDRMAMRCERNTATCLDGKGTSAATAIASASAALIWSKYPEWTANQVLRVLIDTAGKPKTGEIPSKYIGYGVVRPRIALADDSIDPGDPDKNPLFSKYYAKQEEKSDSSEGPDDGKSGSDISEEDQKTQGDASEKDSNSLLVPAIAVGAVALLGVAVVGVLLRRRTRVPQ